MSGNRLGNPFYLTGQTSTFSNAMRYNANPKKSNRTISSLFGSTAPYPLDDFGADVKSPTNQFASTKGCNYSSGSSQILRRNKEMPTINTDDEATNPRKDGTHSLIKRSKSIHVPSGHLPATSPTGSSHLVRLTSETFTETQKLLNLQNWQSIASKDITKSSSVLLKPKEQPNARLTLKSFYDSRTLPTGSQLSPNKKAAPVKHLGNSLTSETTPNEDGDSCDINKVAVSCDKIMPNSDFIRGDSLFFQNVVIPNSEPSRCSNRRNGIVQGYAAATSQGLVRTYNEDRVAIILNVTKPISRAHETWPKCSFFGIYDGHGGVLCADFLRDNLHQFVIQDQNFPWNPKAALKAGFEAAEKEFLSIAAKCEPINRSGSCANVALIVGDMCYVANVGDSRAVMSGSNGTRAYTLTRDHKPMDDRERTRILEAGGQIYQSQGQTSSSLSLSSLKKEMPILGPHRVFPGRLSVSRTFGDIEAKLPSLGGNPKVVVPEPDIKVFRVVDEHDFIVLGCDGIFDKLSSKETIESVWQTIHWNREDIVNTKTIHEVCGISAEGIMKSSLYKRTCDNITVVLIAFQNFQDKLNCKTISEDSPLRRTAKESIQVIDKLRSSINNKGDPFRSSNIHFRKAQPVPEPPSKTVPEETRESATSPESNPLNALINQNIQLAKLYESLKKRQVNSTTPAIPATNESITADNSSNAKKMFSVGTRQTVYEKLASRKTKENQENSYVPTNEKKYAQDVKGNTSMGKLEKAYANLLKKSESNSLGRSASLKGNSSLNAGDGAAAATRATGSHWHSSSTSYFADLTTKYMNS